MKEEKDNNVKIYEVPALGSLGLLALGDIGLKLWREKRDSEEAKEKKDTENSKEDE